MLRYVLVHEVRSPVLLLALLIAGCTSPVDVGQTVIGAPLPAAAPEVVGDAAVAAQPLPAAVAAAGEAVGAVQEAAQSAVSALPSVATYAPAPVSPNAVFLIVRWEVSSPAYYTKRLQQPIWPGGSSGVTWCIGYDGGHQREEVILEDWPKHGERTRLATTAGIRGTRAKALLRNYRDIVTGYEDCVEVFSTRTLIQYERMAARAFSNGYDLLPPNARGVLVSLVYNRGAAMSGDSRLEMRVLRDECVPNGDLACMAQQIRSMCRLWRGTINENGLCARRNDEARLVLIN